jgi:hypothetical protein
VGAAEQARLRLLPADIDLIEMIPSATEAAEQRSSASKHARFRFLPEKWTPQLQSLARIVFGF